MKKLVTSALLVIALGACASEATKAKPKTPPATEPTVTEAPSTNDSEINLAEFDQVTVGMSLDQVAAIVGSAGVVSSQMSYPDYPEGSVTLESRTWDGNTIASSASVSFTNGIVESKYQFGLD